MPVISRFYGFIIKMYLQQKEHNPPHVHALYNGEYMGAFAITDGALMEGDLPTRAQKMVAEWISVHRDELLEMWQTQNFKTLPPLE